MSSVSVELPIRQEQVRDKVREIASELSRVRAEEKQLLSLLKAVRDACSHPSRESGNTWGRWEYTECKVCGKEW